MSLSTDAFRRGEENLCSIESVPAAHLASPAPFVTSSRSQELELLRRRVDELQQQIAQPPPAGIIESIHPPIVIGGAEEPASLQARSLPQSEQQLERQPERDTGDDTCDPVLQDAASILEFLAWGRRKDPDVHSIGTSAEEPPVRDEHGTDPFSDCNSLAVIQLLLPDAAHVQMLVDYHCDSLLWYHGSFFAPTFRAQLQTFWGHHGGKITSKGLNLQWVALLFSVMAGSLTCASSAQAKAWGYRDVEQATLAKRWFQAVTTCLNCANYTARLSLLSCQAIATGTIAAHLLGFSSSQSIHLAAAVRIAQSLGLHKLSLENTGSKREMEIGRRVWTQLCSQDWFGIPFSESYLINPLYSTSAPATHCHDHDLTALPVQVPTITSYCRFLYDIASIMPQLQDDMMSCKTPYTRYEQVLKWDACLRSLATQERPAFLNNVPLDPSWPAWVPWARRALAISSSHKIIMIHRSFLSDSFTNNAFAFTRRTCLAASKTIIKEYRLVAAESGPVLWIHQAFAVAAAIILSLDILHQSGVVQINAEHLQLIETVVQLLRSCRNSMIALRGIKLLEALLIEIHKSSTAPRGLKRHRDGTMMHTFNVPAFVRSFCDGTKTLHGEITPTVPQEPPPIFSTNEAIHVEGACPPESILDVDFAPSVLDGANGFENLLYLANHDFAGSWT